MPELPPSKAELPGGLCLHEARSFGERRRGLMGLDALPSGTALLLAPCRAVHTFGMRFALDLVWVDRERRPVRVDRAVPPRRHRMCLRAHGVVECAAGSGERFAEALRAA